MSKSKPKPRDFAAVVRRRLEAGANMTELAEDCGVSRVYLHALVRRGAERPFAATVQGLAAGLLVSTEEVKRALRTSAAVTAAQKPRRKKRGKK